MPLSRLIDRFAEEARLCAGRGALQALLEDAARELGFRFVALLHHAALQCPDPRLIRFDNYPEGWEAELKGLCGPGEDPIHLAAARTNVGFSWDELGGLVSLQPRHRAILEASRRFGLGPGFTVPVAVPYEPTGSCSFAVAAGRPLPASRLLCAEQIGAHAFHAARRLGGRVGLAARPRLSRRELQCLRLTAAGKTDWETGVILGISQETVHQYIKRARAAYNVVSRTQLVACALRDGLIEASIPPNG